MSGPGLEHSPAWNEMFETARNLLVYFDPVMIVVAFIRFIPWQPVCTDLRFCFVSGVGFNLDFRCRFPGDFDYVFQDGISL